MDLKGKIALVTGGAAGIGKAFCEELLRHGCKISICDINADAGDDLIQHLGNRYGKDRILYCQGDVTDYMQFEESFQTTISTFGGVDIVINNAGIMNDRFWELEVDVNLNGVIRGMLLAFRFMGRDRGGRGGVVINTGSNVCVRPYVSIPIYTATKHAILGLTRSYGMVALRMFKQPVIENLRTVLEISYFYSTIKDIPSNNDSLLYMKAQYHVNLTGVKVMAICPSATDSDLVQDVKKQLLSPDYENAWKQDTANTIPQKPEHVAKALIQVLQKGTSGSCWLVENCQPPKEIPTLHH